MKWRTLQPTTINHVAGVSHRLEICVTNERSLQQDQVQFGIGTKVRLLVGILG